MRASLVLTMGLYRSGSTWMFNAARLLMEAAGARVSSGFHDRAGSALDCPDDFDARLLKAHHLAPGEMQRIGERGGRMILTVRDPRDCVASFMSTFGRDFQASGRAVTASCASAFAAARILDPRIHRFEDHFIDQRETLADLAVYLQLFAVAGDIDGIFAELRPSSVEARIARLTSDGIIDPARRGSHDPVGHWHPAHLGDGKIGKYRELLTVAQTTAIERATRPFMERFGYC